MGFCFFFLKQFCVELAKLTFMKDGVCFSGSQTYLRNKDVHSQVQLSHFPANKLLLRLMLPSR